MRTFADMTPGECIEYVGTWCEDIYGDRYIFLGNTARDEETGAPMGSFLDILEADIIDAPLAAFATRHDLPRAWTPDGDPPAGEWQTAKTKITLNDNTKYDPERNIITGDAVADPDHEPRSSHDIRRWVGEWEEA